MTNDSAISITFAAGQMVITDSFGRPIPAERCTIYLVKGNPFPLAQIGERGPMVPVATLEGSAAIRLDSGGERHDVEDDEEEEA